LSGPDTGIFFVGNFKFIWQAFTEYMSNFVTSGSRCVLSTTLASGSKDLNLHLSDVPSVL